MTAITRLSGARRSRAARPGSGRVQMAITVAVFAALLAVLGYGIRAAVGGSSLGSGNPTTWLPKQQFSHPVDRTVVGTVSAPAITVAGDDVSVRTPTFSAMAVVTGPLVPGEGFSYQPLAVTATWTVHIWDVKGNIGLAAADFDNLDHSGTEFEVQPPPGTTMPKSVSTGGQVTFQLRAVVPIGEDLFRWAPDGNNIVAKWDNQVEND